MLRVFPIQADFPSTPLGGIDGETLTVLRRPYAFDTGRLVTWTPPAEVNKYVLPGTPIHLTWGTASTVTDSLYGYVHAVRPLIDGLTQMTEILFTDAAAVMVSQQNRVYRKMAVSNVVRDVVDDYRLYLEVDNTPLILDVIEEGELSDWDFLVSLAQQSDHILLANGTTIQFRNLADLWAENAQDATEAGTYSYVVTPDARMSEFKPDYSTTRTENDLYVQNFQFRPESWSTYFPYRAVGKMQAPFGVRPFDVFRVAESDAAHAWTVLNVKHQITDEGYVGEILFGGDGSSLPPAAARELLSVSQALSFGRKGARPVPILMDYQSIFAAALLTTRAVGARWESDRLVPPSTVESEVIYAGGGA